MLNWLKGYHRVLKSQEHRHIFGVVSVKPLKAFFLAVVIEAWKYSTIIMYIMFMPP